MADTEKKYCFKLKSGSHVHIDSATGKEQIVEPGGRLYTDVDMRVTEGRDRWELVEEAHQDSVEDLKARIKQLENLVKQEAPVPPVSEDDGLEKMSISALKKMAADMDPPVNLDTCTGKTEIVNAIRNALDAA